MKRSTYKCLYCGRVMAQKIPHKCCGNFRKRKLKFEEIITTKEEYIDLGLPSSNLWKVETEEGYYTYDEAVREFGNNLPHQEDFKELYDNCTWTWDNERKGIEFTSKTNGKKIFFYANGYSNAYDVGSHGFFWSSTLYSKHYAYNLAFSSFNVYPDYFIDCGSEQSVRVVQRPNKSKETNSHEEKKLQYNEEDKDFYIQDWNNNKLNIMTMTTKEMIAVMTAFEEGKKIERKSKYGCISISDNGTISNNGGGWEDDFLPLWDWNNYEYRIKPEEPKPKYRPYQNAEELDEAIKEHGIWLKSKKNTERLPICRYDDFGMNAIRNYGYYYEYYTWLDGTPFGIKEE